MSPFQSSIFSLSIPSLPLFPLCATAAVPDLHEQPPAAQQIAPALLAHFAFCLFSFSFFFFLGDQEDKRNKCFPGWIQVSAGTRPAEQSTFRHSAGGCTWYALVAGCAEWLILLWLGPPFPPPLETHRCRQSPSTATARKRIPAQPSRRHTTPTLALTAQLPRMRRRRPTTTITSLTR